MKTNILFPKTLQEAIKQFADSDVALRFMVRLRWPDGVKCPRCGSDRVNFISTRRVWKCNACPGRKQFSAKVGTIFEDSPLGFDKWLPAFWMAVNCKNGISSYELARGLGVTQKSAWSMLHRIRVSLTNGSIEKLSGTVEADETFMGGKAINMHASQRKARIAGRGPTGKAIVMGLLERGGQVRAHVVTDTKRHTLHAAVKAHVALGYASVHRCVAELRETES
jgi:transposase-like protein